MLAPIFLETVRHLILLLTTFLITTSSYGQKDKFEPTIVILYPFEKVYSDEIRRELQEFKRKRETEFTEEQKEALMKDVGSAKNWRKIREAEIDFLGNQDFFTHLTFGCEIYLSFKLFEYNPDFLALPARDSCKGDLATLKTIAKKHNVDWVLNFPKIALEKKGDKKITTVTFQLYNVNADKVLFEKVYTGTNKNPGLEFTCENDEDSWRCTLNSLESVALFDILDEINRGKKYWR